MHGAGGAERQLVMLANSLSKSNKVFLVAVCDCNICYDLEQNVEIIDLSQNEKKAKNKVLFRYKALKKVYKKLNPDISIHFWMQSAFLSLLMKKRIRGKVLYSERGDPKDKEYRGFRKIIQSYTFSFSNGIVFQTKGAQSLFRERITKKSIVIHNAVSVSENDFISPCSERTKTIVSVGRLHPQKNQRLLIDAFSMIQKEFPEYTLEIYGDGPLKESLNDYIVSLGLNHKIRVLNSTNRIHEIMYSSSLFVLTSNYEGLPNALLEALSLGVPCISTDCSPGGARELIDNRKNGLLVPVGDLNALACSMRELLNDALLQRSFSKEASKTKQRHSSNEIYKQWEKYLIKVVGDKK